MKLRGLLADIAAIDDEESENRVAHVQRTSAVVAELSQARNALEDRARLVAAELEKKIQVERQALDVASPNEKHASGDGTLSPAADALQVAQAENTQLKAQLREVTSRVARLETRSRECQERTSCAEASLRDLRTLTQTLERDRASAEDRAGRAEAEATQLRRNLEAVLAEGERQREVIARNLEVGRTETDESSRREAETKLESALDNVRRLEKRVDELQGNLAEEQGRGDELADKLRSMVARVSDAYEELQLEKEKVEELENQLKERENCTQSLMSEAGTLQRLGDNSVGNNPPMQPATDSDAEEDERDALLALLQSSQRHCDELRAEVVRIKAKCKSMENTQSSLCSGSERAVYPNGSDVSDTMHQTWQKITRDMQEQLSATEGELESAEVRRARAEKQRDLAQQQLNAEQQCKEEAEGLVNALEQEIRVLEGTMREQHLDGGVGEPGGLGEAMAGLSFDIHRDVSRDATPSVSATEAGASALGVLTPGVPSCATPLTRGTNSAGLAFAPPPIETALDIVSNGAAELEQSATDECDPSIIVDPSGWPVLSSQSPPHTEMAKNHSEWERAASKSCPSREEPIEKAHANLSGTTPTQFPNVKSVQRTSHSAWRGDHDHDCEEPNISLGAKVLGPRPRGPSGAVSESPPRRPGGGLQACSVSPLKRPGARSGAVSESPARRPWRGHAQQKTQERTQDETLARDERERLRSLAIENVALREANRKTRLLLDEMTNRLRRMKNAAEERGQAKAALLAEIAEVAGLAEVFGSPPRNVYERLYWDSLLRLKRLEQVTRRIHERERREMILAASESDLGASSTRLASQTRAVLARFDRKENEGVRQDTRNGDLGTSRNGFGVGAAPQLLEDKIQEGSELQALDRDEALPISVDNPAIIHSTLSHVSHSNVRDSTRSSFPSATAGNSAGFASLRRDPVRGWRRSPSPHSTSEAVHPTRALASSSPNRTPSMQRTPVTATTSVNVGLQSTATASLVTSPSWRMASPSSGSSPGPPVQVSSLQRCASSKAKLGNTWGSVSVGELGASLTLPTLRGPGAAVSSRRQLRASGGFAMRSGTNWK